MMTMMIIIIIIIMEKIEISLSSYANHNNNLKRPTEQKHFVDMPNHYHCIADCFFLSVSAPLLQLAVTHARKQQTGRNPKEQ